MIGTRTVLHVTNIPTPYRLPQYRAFAEALGSDGLRLLIYFIGSGNRQRRWQINPQDLVGLNTLRGDRRGSLLQARGIMRAIVESEPAVVVLAWAMDATALITLAYCRRRRIPCVVYTGDTTAAAHARTWSRLRDAWRRAFFKCANGWIAYGSASRDYVISRGVSPEAVHTAINVVDTAYFAESVAGELQSGRASEARSGYRNQAGQQFACHLLCVGEFLQWKRVPLLLEALAATRRPDIVLHLVGSGPDERSIEARVDALGLRGQVVFHGYQQKSALPRFYALAEVFAFPSSGDVFGLVLVEAAAAGLPIIASTLSGGTRDVVMDGINGVVVDPFDTDRFAAAIVRLADDPELRASYGAASGRHAREHLSLERSAAGYRRAIARVLR